MRSTLLPLFCLLLSSATKPLPAGAASPGPVLDTSGQQLLPGVPYYIIPATGGAFALAAYENDSCPLLVVQQKVGSLKAPPVIFSPAKAEARVIQTSMNLNVKFSTTSKTSCADSMVWRLLKRTTEARFISTDGVEGNPSFNTIVNWFMIEKADKSRYKLKFCPTEICKCGVVCTDLGIYVGDDKKRYLGLADKLQPINIVFNRAS